MIRVSELYFRRAPGNTCLAALRTADFGCIDAPQNNSKGYGGVVRVAPVGLFYAGMPDVDAEGAFDCGCDAAAITHGHPTGYLTAGFLTALIYQIVRGLELEPALALTLDLVRNYEKHEETTAAVTRAMEMAQKQPYPSPEAVEQLGGGWI